MNLEIKEKPLHEKMGCTNAGVIRVCDNTYLKKCNLSKINRMFLI